MNPFHSSDILKGRNEKIFCYDEKVDDGSKGMITGFGVRRCLFYRKRESRLPFQRFAFCNRPGPLTTLKRQQRQASSGQDCY